VPVAGFATRDGDALFLQGLVGDATNGELVRSEAVGSVDDPHALGLRVAEGLLAAGADRLLAHLSAH
jgi:hydroxymethylbilane synthase